MSDTLRTSVNQAPHGGSLYPFVTYGDGPGAVLDFYVSYEDDARELVLPFALGVGGDNITITDANNATVVDTLISAATTTAWGGDRIIYEWIGDTYVMRIVAVALGDLSVAVLDPRTCDRLPARVKSLTVGVVNMQGAVDFKAGNNILLSGNDTVRTDGTKFVDQVNIDAVPGAGAGRVTGCDDAAVQIRRINQITPDCGGDFKIQVDDCFRPKLPLSVADGLATYYADGLTEAQAKAAIQLTSDCHPCRDCDYYVRTYRGLKRVWNRWKDAAGDAETTRDTFADNRSRWLASKECREANKTRMVLRTLNNCKVSAGGSLCNATDECVRNVELRFTVDPLATYTEAYLDASTTDGEEPYAPLVDYNVFRFFVDYMEPRSLAVAKIRLCVIGCGTVENPPTTVEVTFETFIDGQPADDPIIKNVGLIPSPASFSCCG